MINKLFIMVYNLFTTTYNLFTISKYKEKIQKKGMLINKIKCRQSIIIFEKIGMGCNFLILGLGGPTLKVNMFIPISNIY